VGAFELATLVLAAGLERLEKFFDRPPAAVAVDYKGDLVGGIDWQTGQEKPFDSGLSWRRVWLEDVNDV
jgi:hypothetical protein